MYSATYTLYVTWRYIILFIAYYEFAGMCTYILEKAPYYNMSAKDRATQPNTSSRL